MAKPFLIDVPGAGIAVCLTNGSVRLNKTPTLFDKIAELRRQNAK
jgi:hypothetical protein